MATQVYSEFNPALTNPEQTIESSVSEETPLPDVPTDPQTDYLIFENPTLTSALNSSGFSPENQQTLLKIVLETASQLEEIYQHPGYISSQPENNILNGIDPHAITTQDAMKIAAGIVEQMVRQAAEAQKEEQKKMAQIQATMEEIPANLKSFVISSYDLSTMTPSDIIAIVNIELAKLNQNEGNTNDLVA